MKNRISKKTIALLAAAVVLLAGGGVMGTRAQLNVFSDPYNAEFALDHIGITITEDGNDVGKTEMLQDVKLQPGKVVDEKIAALNTTEINQFVRIIVTRYWTDPEGKKDPTLDPGLIKLVGGSGWIKNTAESTAERDVYYYPTALAGNTPTSTVYDGFKVDSKVLSLKDDEGNLLFDNCSVNIKVEVQSVQTHNAADAIRSTWGVENVTADEDTLQLKVQ